MIYENRWKHSVETLKELFLPNLLGSLTTAFGFLALVPSEIPIIKQYGWVVFLLVSGFAIFGQVLVLLALPWVKPSMRKWFDEKAQWALFPIHHSKLILSGVVSVFLISLIGIPFLNFSGKLFTDLPPEHPAQRATLKLDERNGGLISYDLMLSAEEDGFFKKQENIYKIQRLTQYLRQDPRFGSVISLPDLFQGPIPKTQDAISETLFLFTMAEKNPLTGFVTEDGKKLRLMIRFNDQTSQTIFLLRQWIADSVKTFIPNVKLSEGGMAVAHHTINQMVAKDLIFTFWHPLILIGVLLIIVFRSFRWALTACLPNLIPPVVLVGAMAFSQVVVKPSVALVFAIALGFAFNNTIYLLARLRKQNELRETMLVEGNPCAFESLVMFLGFSVFIFSQFNVNKLFGLFMMISIFVGFVGDLLFLPAFLSRYPQWLGLNLNSNQSEVKTKLRLISDKLNEDKEKVATFEEEEEVTRYYPAASVVLGLIFLGTTVGPNALAVTQSQRNRMPASLPNQSHSSGSGVTSTELNSRSVSLSAEDILRKSQTQLDAKDDQAIIELKIIEKNGEEKVRKIDYKSRRKKNFAVLAKIMSPADVKGMSFLGLVEGGEESQWIYIPSSRQVRRVVTGGTKAGLLGSEISAEDLNSQAVKHSKAELIPGSGNYYQIQVVPAKGTSSYSKIISYLSKDQFLPIRADYYVGTKLKKTIEFKEYTKVGPVYRAQKLFVSNLLNGRKTEVKFAGLKVNSGLSEEEFTQNALKKNR